MVAWKGNVFIVEEYFQCSGESVDSLDEAIIHVVSQASELYSKFGAEVEHHGGFATSSFGITKDKDGYSIKWINLNKVKGQGGASGKVMLSRYHMGKRMDTLFLKLSHANYGWKHYS